jgi:hypothetical protein
MKFGEESAETVVGAFFGESDEDPVEQYLRKDSDVGSQLWPGTESVVSIEYTSRRKWCIPF